MVHTSPLLLSTLGLLPFAAAQLSTAQWDAAYAKAQVAIANLTQGEKVGLMTGTGLTSGPCIGNIVAIDSINFPGLCLQDSALGVRDTSGNSAFPAGVNAAATFSRDLVHQRAVAMGQEFRGKGINVQLGPMMNLMRNPDSGRNWEGFGGDPYLSGEFAYETIVGVQAQGVQAVMKHLINNEQEHLRTLESSNVDDRTTHEVYLHPFLKSVQAGVVSAMCSYNRVNSTYACENEHVLTDLVKGELGFRGYIMSDWLATHSTADSANHGLDMEQPSGIILGIAEYFGLALQLANDVGAVATSTLDGMATRILAGYFVLNQDTDFPALNLTVDVQAGHGALIRTLGAASTVLLKNAGALPLAKPARIAVVGSDAGANPNGPNGCTDRNCDSGVLAMGWGSGTANFPYLVTPLDAITNRSALDNTTVTSSLSDTDLDAAGTAAEGADVAFVFLSADSGEDGNIVEWNAGDRNDLNAWHSGDALVQKVASVNKNTVVVVNSVGPLVLEAWIEHPNVTGLVWSGLPGQEAGNALADVLWGAYNPSGRLPYTIARAKADYASTWKEALDIDYDEGLLIDYRWFDAQGIAPRFEFGFGLSYTNFTYADLSISGEIGASYVPPTGNGSSVDPALHQNVFNVSFTVTNTGGVDGHEVPQLYLSRPASTNSPPYELRGFDYVDIPAGKSTQVVLQLSRYDLSVWDVVSQRWVVPQGTTTVSVGASSRDLRLNGTIET